MHFEWARESPALASPGRLRKRHKRNSVFRIERSDWSISLGVYGPRMGQRGTRIAGEPLSVLRNEVAQLYEVAVTATRRDADEDPETVARDAISEVFGPDVPVPDLTAEGCRLEGAMALAVADHRSVWLRYRQASSRFPAMILLVSDLVSAVRRLRRQTS